jgi:nitronate monooxygenase
VAGAGGLGFLAAGYKTAEAMEAEIEATRSLTNLPFGVNVFVPWPGLSHHSDSELEIRELGVAAYAATIESEAEQLGVALGNPRPFDDDSWSLKIDVLERQRCDVVSFTFGVPTTAVVDRLHAVGSRVVVTVTDLEEARAAAGVGANALCVQGPNAGGHRGTHDPLKWPADRQLELLISDMRELGLPILAAGGISDAQQAKSAIEAGAAAVQCGTLYLLAHESGATEPYKSALSSSWADHTVITRAFSGRPARGLKNSFITEHGDKAPVAYPEVNQVTQPLRSAAARRNDPQRMALWAGTGFRNAAYGPAAEITNSIREWVNG